MKFTYSPYEFAMNLIHQGELAQKTQKEVEEQGPWSVEEGIVSVEVLKVIPKGTESEMLQSMAYYFGIELDTPDSDMEKQMDDVLRFADGVTVILNHHKGDDFKGEFHFEFHFEFHEQKGNFGLWYSEDLLN